jgi:hypothetical protein
MNNDHVHPIFQGILNSLMPPKNEYSPDIPHYFCSPELEKSSRFCICGKYLTDEIHFRENDPRKMLGEGWKDMQTAPKDGRTIIGKYGEGEEELIFWSDRPVCMGGPSVYNHAGWATSPEGDTDSNLPRDAPMAWKDY